ncbi:hypothetical protein CEE37_13275 [candidate division LCP-89 bacterium B3_LCP]|uniref:Uncharacterized protein n=1 Tax=candidate division LCP-89 bacterium B3_LCP TaxID=2012998 RepID=A0A532USL8_UNCL8|nr:MAG: hypothetical protein CEE37_13275 [candidate division LCP-89 bacterium B3_LCP]
MNALISGQAGIAIFVETTGAFVVDIDSPDQERSLPKTSIPYVFNGASDVKLLKSVKRKKALETLELEWRKDRALQLMLILIDDEDDIETKREAAECLTELLSDKQVFEFLSNRMFSAPFPDDTNLEIAYKCGAQAEPVIRLLDELSKNQIEIDLYRQEWDNLSPDLFDDDEDVKSELFHRIVEEGIFRDFVLTAKDAKKFSLVEFDFHKKFGREPNAGKILSAWTASLKPVDSEQDFSQMIEEEPERQKPPKEKRGRKVKPKKADEALADVIKTKDFIKSAMQKGEIVKARRFTQQLVTEGEKTSTQEQIAKSLCDLAQYAKEIKNHSFQLELAQWANRIAPSDVRTHIQLGDAFFCLKRNDEALKAYDTAIRDFPPNVVSHSGRAEVLKEMGKLEEALKAYDAAICDLLPDVVSHNGRAEVLKEMGKLEEALKAYDTTIRDFPPDIVSHSGRAEVLKEMGRLEEALKAYDTAIRDFQPDVVSHTGRASILKEMGRLEEALRAYDTAIRDFPLNVYSHNGRAEVFKEMGKLEEALKAYDTAISDFPPNVVSHSGRAEVLKEMGKLEEALIAYDTTIRDLPPDAYSYTGRAGVLKEMGMHEEALKFYDETIIQFPTNKVAPNARSALLVLMGRYHEAEVSLPVKEPQTKSEWIAHHIRGMILLKTGKVQEASEHFDFGLNSSPFPSDKKYYRSALAVAKLQANEFAEAAECLGDDQTPINNILRMHIYGEGRLSEFEGIIRTAHEYLKQYCPSSLFNLYLEVTGRYLVDPDLASLSNDELIKQECDYVIWRIAA